MEALLASFGRVAIADGEATRPSFLTHVAAAQPGLARRDNIVPIVSVDPTLEEGQSMTDVASSIDNEIPDQGKRGFNAPLTPSDA